MSDKPTREELIEALTFYGAAWKLGHDNFIEPSDRLLADCGSLARNTLRGNEPIKPAPEVKRTMVA